MLKDQNSNNKGRFTPIQITPFLCQFRVVQPGLTSNFYYTAKDDLDVSVWLFGGVSGRTEKSTYSSPASTQSQVPLCLPKLLF